VTSQNNGQPSLQQYFDIVCVVKKQIQLDKKREEIIKEFEKNIYILFTKAFNI
jgi:hypothetical protein